MARPRRFDSADVDDALLRVFWSRGWARASIEELTAATGLLRGSLYAAYGSKEDMFRAAMRRYVADLTAAVTSDARGLAGVQHVFDTVVRLTARDPERRGCLVLNAIPESRGMSAGMRRELQRHLDAMPALLRARLREAQADAKRRDVDLEALVSLLFGALVAIRVLGRAGHERRLLQSIARGAMDAARQGFANPRKD